MTNVLGVRCSNRDYTYAVLAGSKTAPLVLTVNKILFPKNFAKPQSLKWFYQEIDALLSGHSIQTIVIKGFEGRTRGKAYETRIEHEAMIFLAAADRAIKPVLRKIKSTIAKDLGLKGRSRYLSTLDTSIIPNFHSWSTHIQEAVVAAWSELS